MGKSKNFFSIALIFLLVTSSASASLFYACANLLNFEKKEWINDKVSFIHYPGTAHAKIEVNGRVYNPAAGFEYNGTIEQYLYNPFYARTLNRVRIRVTPEELERMDRFVKDPKFRFQTCSGGACRTINSNTGMIIPFFVKQTPMSALFYFKTLKATGLDFGRIVSIDKHGSNRFFKRWATPEWFGVAFLAFASGLVYHDVEKAEAEREIKHQSERALLATGENYWAEREHLNPFRAISIEKRVLFFRGRYVQSYSPEEGKKFVPRQITRNSDPEIIYFLSTQDGVFLVAQNEPHQYELHRLINGSKTRFFERVGDFKGNPFTNGKYVLFLDSMGKILKITNAGEAIYTGFEGFSAVIYSPGKGWMVEKEEGQLIPVNSLQIP